VVGVVPDYLQTGQRSAPDAVAILPFRQDPRPWMSVLAHTRVNVASFGNTFRREVQGIDPDLPVRDLLTLDDQLALSRWPLGVLGSMFTMFAGIALLLATVGLYAVVAYGVSQRTHEIGLRVALGASAASILRMVFTSGMLQAYFTENTGLQLPVNKFRHSLYPHTPILVREIVFEASLRFACATTCCFASPPVRS